MARDKVELICLAEAAKICGLSPDHLRRLARTNKLWAKKIGPIWVTTAEAVQEYIAKGIRPGPKPKQD